MMEKVFEILELIREKVYEVKNLDLSVSYHFSLQHKGTEASAREARLTELRGRRHKANKDITKTCTDLELVCVLKDRDPLRERTFLEYIHTNLKREKAIGTLYLSDSDLYRVIISYTEWVGRHSSSLGGTCGIREIEKEVYIDILNIPLVCSIIEKRLECEDLKVYIETVGGGKVYLID